MAKHSKEEIDNTLEDIRSHVDYQIGDWVETCNLMPGIVQSIDIKYNEEDEHFHDTVKIFYPHYAFRDDLKGKYKGGSNCSVCHCGVHKITPEYACKLMAVGEKNLRELWEQMTKDAEHTQEPPCWEDYVEKKYNELFPS